MKKRTAFEMAKDYKSIEIPQKIKRFLPGDIRTVEVYGPEWDCWRIAPKEAGRVFKDSFGPFHTVIDYETMTFADFYLMGPL